jgi:molybdopterin synthase sulfur carrier subunit
MKLLYFAWLRTRLGVGEEQVAPPAEVATVAQLIVWLRRRGPAWESALADLGKLRVAVNQDYVGLDHPLRLGDEVALFPPVTGG